MSSPVSTDLKLYYCGHEICKPGHSCGPAMRDHYLLVYIQKGRGTYRINNISYQLQKDDSFLLFPNVPAYYEADNNDPWEYMWIGFYGNMAAKYLEYADISIFSPIHHHEDSLIFGELFQKILQYPRHISIYNEMHCLGLLHILFSELVRDCLQSETSHVMNGRSTKDDYIQKAIEYIHLSYTQKISISSIAEHIGLERSYFTKLFKENMGIAPYEFLLKYKIDKAQRLLIHTNLQIEHVAYSVGFPDPLYFSKVFRKYLGMSPSAFRKSTTAAL